VRQSLLISLLCSLFMVLRPTWALDINHATEAELDSLRGMGPALSARVLAARKQMPFASWQDLMQRASGIGRTKAIQFSEQGLTVNGQAFSPRLTP
jgi:competence protein ComEA